ncbi:MAG: hypothetical protein GXY58_08050 [Planctomycetaceae bacterium]|nr:hypothetical protein [Planctomycetaceae bacterium]
MHTAVISEMDGVAAYLAHKPLVTVLGVKYLHLRAEDGTDLYVTEFGIPFTRCLLPENHWADAAWMKQHGVRLPGTSALFRVRTKEVDGRACDIVVKWNRMGQDIPGGTRSSDGDVEFNSPFMEFSLVIEMRNSHFESPGRLYTHRPLAIYVPRKFVQGEQLGRRRYKMEAIQRSHEEIPLDWNRNYAVIYDWLKGIDAMEACRDGLIDKQTMTSLVDRCHADLDRKGFSVSDNKPHHIIVRPTPDGQLKKDRAGQVIYGLVDFELLKRTPRRDKMFRAKKRQEYLIRQVRRFESSQDFPPNLTPVTILGVDYVYGRVESTGGALWVVGRDPMLFDYFLPEKWRRTPRTKISASQLVYETVTKDNIHLVWRVSRVGQIPDADPFMRRERQILDYGYNSPFEEFSIAMELSRRGIETTYPRAIYMTGHCSSVSSSLVDNSRYVSHASLQTPDHRVLLSRQHEYITIWGYWNGPDESLADKDEVVYKGIDALAAYREGRLTQRAYVRVMQAARRRLVAAGIEDLSLRGNHLLLSIDRDQKLAVDDRNMPLMRICNFELLQKIEEVP